MPSYIDPLTSQIVWSCPRCGGSIRCEDLLELDKLEKDSACERCRAGEL